MKVYLLWSHQMYEDSCLLGVYSSPPTIAEGVDESGRHLEVEEKEVEKIPIVVEFHSFVCPNGVCDEGSINSIHLFELKGKTVKVLVEVIE